MSVLAALFNIYGCPVDRDRVGRVANAYAHYGPDGVKLWCDGPAAMLQWTSVSTPESLGESLPLTCAANNLTIAADARLDNREELKDRLGVPQTGEIVTDAALIMGAFQKWGQNCPDQLEGDFSFVIFDRRQRQLFCAQSPFPMTPLYFVRTDQRFAVGSLIRPLLSLTGLPKRLNEKSLAHLIGLSGLKRIRHPGSIDETMFAGVSMMPVASTLLVKNGGSLQLRNYWQPDANRELAIRSDDECYEALREILVRAVRDRMRSHKPVACYLSGGLDSSAITCIAARQLRESGNPLTAISSVLPENHDGPETDEREFIDVVREQEGLNMAYVHPRGGLLDPSTFRRYMDILERPVLDYQHYVYTAFHETARARGVGAVLDGVGGELGPSYKGDEAYAHWTRTGQWHHLIRGLRAQARTLDTSAARLFARYVVAPHMRGIVGLYQRIRYGGNCVQPFALPIQREFAQAHGVIPQIDMVKDDPFRGVHSPKKFLAQAAWHYMRILTDRNMDQRRQSMVFGVRTYYPYLDRRVIDFCLAVPSRLYSADGWRRSLIRRSMDGILPPQIQWRKCKKAFSPDYHRRFLAAKDEFYDLFASVGQHEVVRKYLDVDQLLSTLGRLGTKHTDDTSGEDLTIHFSIQTGLAVLQFLRWFEAIDSCAGITSPANRAA